MRFALWQLLVFLERGLSGNKERASAGDQRCLGPRGAVGTDRASAPLRLFSVQAAPLTPLGVTLFEPAELGPALFGAGQEDDAVGRCTVYKLQLSCIGLRLISLSPPVTCCWRTVEATLEGIETTALGIVRARNCARLGLSMLNPHGMVSRYRVPSARDLRGSPFLSLQIQEQQKKPRYLDPSFLACHGPSGLPGAPKDEREQWGPHIPNHVSPHAVPFHFGRRASPNWLQLRHSFSTACVPTA